MIFWILLLALLIAFPPKKDSICWFFFVLIGFICAFRFEIGYDYNNYMSFLNNTYEYDIQYDRLEPLGKFLIQLAVFFNWPQLFFIITSIIIYGSVAYFIREESDDAKMSIIIFMSLPTFFWNSLSIVRQFLALSCGLFMIMSIYKGHIKKSVIFYVLAVLSHGSAFLLILTYFAKYIKFSKKYYLLIFIASFFLFFLMQIIIDKFNYLYIFHQANMYLEKKDEFTGGSKIGYLYDLIFIVILWASSKTLLKNEKIRYYFNLFFFGVVIYNLFRDASTMGARLAGYYMFALVVLLPNWIKLMLKNNSWQAKAIVYGCLICIYVYTLHLADVTFQNNLSVQNPYCPYKNVLFK